MSGASKKLMGTTAAGDDLLAIEDVFSTYLYTGDSTNPSSKVNGIDLASEGGMVWLKSRTGAYNNYIADTERPLSSGGGATWLYTNTTDAVVGSIGTGLMTFNSDGFSTFPTGVGVNASGQNYASWTFRKAPRFFDVVTWTGTGVARTIAHNLGSDVGTLIVKRTDSNDTWMVWHRSRTGEYGALNGTQLFQPAVASIWNSTDPTSTEFSVGSDPSVNASGGTYVAYLFAHDPLGPSGDGSDGLIACGSYTGTGVEGNNTIQIGWEPQWILAKRADAVSSGWLIFDTMRGLTHGNPANDAYLWASLANAEGITTAISPEPTGFTLETSGGDLNASGGTYVYIAIRRGPMRQPESGTEVFAAELGDGSSDPGFNGASGPIDFFIRPNRTGTSRAIGSRLQGRNFMQTNSTGAESVSTVFDFDYMNGFYNSSSNTSEIAYMFRRAPGFFDVVAYTGNGVAGRTVPHNLGVAPEMIITKNRGATDGWRVYNQTIGNNKSLRLDTDTPSASGSIWNNTTPTESVFTVGATLTNASSNTYIAYLFATLPGVSKVGSYTGNGTSQTIDCGFTTGARFVLIKRTDSTGDWYVWDTARGIVTGNDPFLELNTTDAEVTSDDSIDPDSSGFIVNQTATTNVNVSSASYIFYAVS